jgi:hypothetical protein
MNSASRQFLLLLSGHRFLPTQYAVLYMLGNNVIGCCLFPPSSSAVTRTERKVSVWEISYTILYFVFFSLVFFLRFRREREGGWRRLQGAGGEEGSARALRGPNSSPGRLQTLYTYRHRTRTLLLAGAVKGSIQTGTRKNATPLW